ncbi:ethylene-responsive transcription factor ERF017-like [Olea europaea subsp. europaea]|uniref:Ethylene-responsive transcription factor ERF017-like n=1 Tax=Olea europaea subsp. europaea TaxID=158383 RepID=A0A8S0TKX3_OLEEU|nr:ethylene-responsive transcription factor ERF017-like [Olea europaea subsp. europaea]
MVKKKDSSSSSQNENNEVKYKGVRKRKWGKYVSEIRLPNSRERIWLGSYQTAEKAAKAFDAALYCLRGCHAKFNFPHDPPNIAGGQALTPAEIQVVAQQYANNSSSTNHRPPTELEDESPSSNSEGAGTMDSIDWSFLDMLDSNDHAGNVSDFGVFPEPGDMYVPPNFVYHGNNEDDHDNEDTGGHFSSFLWNF